MPRLSILMPVRDGARHLRRAMMSTLAAMPLDSELVVIDDNSVDGSGAIASSTKDRRVRVLSASGVGLASALNEALRLTDSEFVARMDADDICCRWRFRRQLKLVQKVDLVFSAILFADQYGRIRRPDLPGRISAKAMPLHLLLASCLRHPTMLARRGTVFDFGDPYRETAAEDYDLWLRLAANGRRIIRDAVPAISYRQHTQQISTSERWINWRAGTGLADVVSSYSGLAASVGVTADVTPDVVLFALSRVRPSSSESLDVVRRFVAEVGSRGQQLSPADRAVLSLRFGMANLRLRRTAWAIRTLERGRASKK